MRGRCRHRRIQLGSRDRSASSPRRPWSRPRGPFPGPSAARAPSASRPSARASAPRRIPPRHRSRLGGRDPRRVPGPSSSSRGGPRPKPVPVATATAAARRTKTIRHPGPRPCPPPAASQRPPLEKDPFSQARKSVGLRLIAKHSFEKGFATGTGVFVDAQGRVVTNYHVVVAVATDQQVLRPGRQAAWVDARDHLPGQGRRPGPAPGARGTPPVPVAPMHPGVDRAAELGDTCSRPRLTRRARARRQPLSRHRQHGPAADFRGVPDLHPARRRRGPGEQRRPAPATGEARSSA